jgi:hypothetical protein
MAGAAAPPWPPPPTGHLHVDARPRLHSVAWRMSRPGQESRSSAVELARCTARRLSCCPGMVLYRQGRCPSARRRCSL